MDNHNSSAQNKTKRFLFFLTIFIVMLGCVFQIHHSVSLVKEETKGETNDPKDLINHANTLYWFGRAKGNTTIEFEKAAALSELAKSLLEKNNEYTASQKEELIRQADNIIFTSSKTQEQNELTVNNRFPFFLDLMGKYELMEEDEPLDELDKAATCRALENMVNLPDFSGLRKIEDMPYFCLLVDHSGDRILQEAAVQFLNLHSKLYTISDQELSVITHKSRPNMELLIKDTTSLIQVCEFFKVKELMLIEMNKVDHYEGIYYHDSRISRFDLKERKINATKYTYAFTDARQYHTIIFYGFPMLIFMLCFLILAGEFSRKIFNEKDSKIIWHRYIITGLGAFASSIFAIELIAKYFSPASGEFHETDKAELWRLLIAFSVTIIPIMFTHLISGKLDNYKKSFDSGLDNSSGLFSIVFPALSSLPLMLFYYSILRFGFTYHLLFAVISLFTGLVFAVLLSRFWIMLKDIPENSTVFYKYLIGFLLISILTSAVLYAYNIIGFWDKNNTVLTFLKCFLFPCIFAVSLEKIASKGRLLNLEKRIFGFTVIKKNLETNIDSKYISPLDEEAMYNSLHENKLLIVYASMRMGKTTVIENIIEKPYLEKNWEIIIPIDFASENPDFKKEKIHYYPFAKGFGNLLPYSKFNDQADEARKSGNIIAKLFGSVTSAVQLLVDENETKASGLEKVLEMITEKIFSGEKTLIIFENIDKLDEENKGLFILLLNKILKHKEEIKLKKPNPSPDTDSLNLIFSSLPGFHIKKEFERIIVALMELNLKTEKQKLSSPNKIRFAEIIKFIDKNALTVPFFNLYPDPDFLDKYLSKEGVSIFDRKKLAELFRKMEKDKIPGVIVDSIIKMKETGQLQDIDKNGILEFISNHPEESLSDIPQEFNYFQTLLNAIPDNLIDLIRICAYCALDDGEFEVEVVCTISGLDRLSVLKMLGKCEKMNIVYDNRKRNDWYQFNDSRFINVLKANEGNKESQVSQIGKEIYKKWTECYSKKILELEKNPGLNKNTLIKLAERINFTSIDDPSLAMGINERIGLLFLKPEISLFAESENAFKIAISIIDRNKNLFDEKIKYRVLVKGLLMAYRFQSTLNSDNAAEIFKQKKEIISVCPELEFEIQLAEILRFHRNRNAKETVDSFIKLLGEMIVAEKERSARSIRLHFYKILLLQRGKTEIKELKEIENKYELLIKEVEDDKNLLEECTKDGVITELLNSCGCFTIYGILSRHEILSDSQSKELFFDKAMKILKRRIEFELGKTDQKQIETEDHSAFIIKAIEILRLPENKFKTDRAGLCYTLNFITNAFIYRGYVNKKLKISDSDKEVIIACSIFAVELNKEVNSIGGIIASALSKGEIFESIREYSIALESFEIAFAYSFPDDQDNFIIALAHMKRLKEEQAPPTFSEYEINRIEDYCNKNLKRHLLRHFDEMSIIPDNEIHKLEEKDIIKNRDQDLEGLYRLPGSKFRNTAFSSPDKIIKLAKELVEKYKDKVVKESFSRHLTIDLKDEFDKFGMIGIDRLIPLAEISEGIKNQIAKEDREGFECNTITGIEPLETTFLTIEFEGEEGLELETVYPGKWAPPLPNKRGLTKEDVKMCKKFWDGHAFIIPI